MMQARWTVGAMAAVVLMSIPVEAKAPSGLRGLLSAASDSALSRLEKPGAFYADEAIRIGLPGPFKKLSGIMKYAGQAGLTKGLDKSLNDAAGIAAGAAKPVFRNAIDSMTLTDGIGIVTGGGTGATDYLERSSGSVLEGQLQPLVESALRKTGALAKVEKLIAGNPTAAALGLSSSQITKSVTEQTADGIFQYMGQEERKIRANPLGIGKSLLGGG